MHDSGHLSATARILGFAGLLPQLGALLLIASGADGALGALAAFAYAAMVLSFLGGIWWGYAMRAGTDQSWMALLAVSPVLVAFACILLRLAGVPARTMLIAIGGVLMLTLLVDRRIAAAGLVPPGWLQLRLPLSLGLGLLTVIAGLMAPAAVNLVYTN